MTTNRVTLAQLLGMPIKDAVSIPLEQIHLLLEDVVELKSQLKSYTEALDAVLLERFGKQAASARKADGKDTGTVSLYIDGYSVSCDLPKKVTWDQDALKAAVKIIETVWDEDPTEYVGIEIKVSETKFAAWPGVIKKLFEPARTTGTGKATIKVEPMKSRAA